MIEIDVIEHLNLKFVAETEDHRYLYLMINEDNSLCKIGITTDIRGRLNKIRAESGCDIQYIQYGVAHGEIDYHAGYIEKVLHNYFKYKRLQGEWFKLTAEDIEFTTTVIEALYEH